MKLTIDKFSEIGLYADIFDSLNDGINVIDKDGIIVYANKKSCQMTNTTYAQKVGQHITKFTPSPVLFEAIKAGKPILDNKIMIIRGDRYMIKAFPIFYQGEIIGAYSVIKNVQDIFDLSQKARHLELQLSLVSSPPNISNLERHSSIQTEFQKARRIVGALGGPRHSIITGESGTGKTMLAQLIHTYAKKIGVIPDNSPFIEVNCAQFTNPDIAAIELFGSEQGAFTGAKAKKGLFEQANNGILFLDEAHTLGNNQSLLLKAIEEKKIRHIGGNKEIPINVIIIAASTKPLKEVFLPELYQRLGQYELHLPPLRERTLEERTQLLEYFVLKYKKVVKDLYNINLNITISEEAKNVLLNADYPRNVRQFRDVINLCIDSASPLIEDLASKDYIDVEVRLEHIPYEILLSDMEDYKNEINKAPKKSYSKSEKNLTYFEQKILQLRAYGYGARKIAKILNEDGNSIKYYQVSYFLKKHEFATNEKQ